MATSAFTFNMPRPKILDGDVFKTDLPDFGSSSVASGGFNPNMFSTGGSGAGDALNVLGGKPLDINPSAGGLKGLLGDKNLAGNVTGLASTLMQAVALPALLKNAKLQNKSLQFNLDTAKQEQGRRNKNIAGFNRPTSAFAG